MTFPDGLDPQNDRDQKVLAFAAHVAKLVSDADGVLDMNEIGMLLAKFPDSLMESFGFTDQSGAFTDTFRATLTRAKIELPNELSREEKMEMISFFHYAGTVDDEFAPEEKEVVLAAATLLGLDVEDVMKTVT